MSIITDLKDKIAELDTNFYSNQLSDEVKNIEKRTVLAMSKKVPLAIKLHRLFNKDYKPDPRDLTIHPKGYNDDTANPLLMSLYNLYYIKSFSQKQMLLIAGTFAKYAKSGTDIKLALEELGNYKKFGEYQRKLFYDSESVMTTEGYNLWRALDETFGDLIDKRLVSALRVGMDSGKLYESLDNYISDLEFDIKNGSRIKKALAYPLLIIIVILILILGVRLWLIPEMFLAYNIAIPSELNLIMSVSDILMNPLELVKIVIMFKLLGYLVRKYKSLRVMLEMVTLKLPVYGRYMIIKDICTFFRYMYNYVDSGSTTIDAHNDSISPLSVESIKIILHDKEDTLLRGHKISTVYSSISYIPEDVKLILKVAEENGDLADALFSTARALKEEYQNTVDTIVEQMPSMSMILAGALIGVLLLPLMQVMYNLDNYIM